ncbi:MAG: helix-turn-helix domain-containing protein [Humidesulfovibrio sp.]|nr:helix-turn-helix domain-containing protein [Humidesulfovibrio sp.]
MSKNSLAHNALPLQVREALLRLAQNLKVARQRRKMTQAQLAQKVMVSVGTIIRLERTPENVSLSVLAQVLFVLQLVPELAALASPERDTIGMQLELARGGVRVSRQQTSDPGF